MSRPEYIIAGIITIVATTTVVWLATEVIYAGLFMGIVVSAFWAWGDWKTNEIRGKSK